MTTRPNDIAWWIAESIARDHHTYLVAMNHEPNPDAPMPSRDGTFTLTFATDFHGCRVTVEYIDQATAYDASETGNLDDKAREFNERLPLPSVGPPQREMTWQELIGDA